MTTSDRAIAFRLLDDYARSKHQCFVAEFDLDKAGLEYRVCFRPTCGSKGSPNRYACRYLHVGIRDVTEAVEKKELPASVVDLLDRELPSLGVLI